VERVSFKLEVKEIGSLTDDGRDSTKEAEVTEAGREESELG